MTSLSSFITESAGLAMRRYRPYLLFALLTYLWCATGLDRLATLHSVTASEPADTVLMATEQARQLVVHHVGHRDAHEPAVADNADPLDDTDAASHGHGDHVVTYCDDDSEQATTGKDSKLNNVTPVALPTPVATTFACTRHLASRLTSEPVQRRASAEFARTVRLLI
ncbi:hypothetical protein HPT27_12935 [Permianibacter sp. IMCC34836]|uniref:hypothetical protein n=1 Tax=Permianibacter fluminis TaxID=2738515 RepID=UPI001554E050|nr:hypothetical protein [Permianibacter fluminis]NQD37929.1 hypothetical protein [Permianibacter fluminis]